MKPEVGAPCTPLITIMSKSKMARGSGFSRDEIFPLLEIVPIDMDEWAAIERRHEVSSPGQNQTKEGLCQMFQTIFLVKMSTGNPTCPPEV